MDDMESHAHTDAHTHLNTFTLKDMDILYVPLHRLEVIGMAAYSEASQQAALSAS